MSERISIIDEIKKGGYEASLITSYNAYLPFYEEVVLRKLIGQGVHHNVLLMDAAQCAHSVAHHPPRLAGRYYSLVPISSPGAFHPKVILLVGKNKGSLLVGSHNLTLSGFGYNRELTNLVRLQGSDDDEAVSVLQTAWRHVLTWVESQGNQLPSHLGEMVLKLQDFAPWLKTDREAVPDRFHLLAAKPASPSLWDQLLVNIEGEVEQVLVAGAFFDAELRFLQRIKEDLRPKETLVAIDPASVQIPSGLKVEGVRFVNGGKLGATDKNERTGYLHAKALAIRLSNGEFFLATGSANPSAPAWLRPDLTGNTELMLLRQGVEAEQVAKDLGILDIPTLPELSEKDWKGISLNWQKTQTEKKDKSVAVGVGIVTEEGIALKGKFPAGVATLSCEIWDQNRKTICLKTAQRQETDFWVEMAKKDIDSAAFVVSDSQEQQHLFLVHHHRRIEECSRTGPQRRFREAFNSLHTDSPDLETLIKCVDKIIFTKESEVNRQVSKLKQAATVNAAKAKNSSEGTSLSIDLSQTKKSQKKHRLRHSDDLAYLLDVLIYHLRSETERALDSAYEPRDAKGRSEEEQVDADDEETGDITDQDLAQKTIHLCHTKVHTLIGRMINQLHALQEQKISFEDIVIRLTAVLAVLRQLRNCDGKVAWAKQGQTTFPAEERRRLFEAIAYALFEAPNSLLYPPEEIGLEDADEFARLRGLVLWLAWDCGIRLVTPKGFCDSFEDERERLRVRALMVSLAQLVGNDEVVMEEARQSIGPLCSSDMDWLEWIFSANKSLTDLAASSGMHPLGSKTKRGDIALIEAAPQLGFRLIINLDGGKADLAFFDREKGYRRYLQKAIRSVSFDKLMA